MKPQDRSLKHHDTHRKRTTWRKMKMFFRVETRGGRRMNFLLSSVGFQLWVAQRLLLWWFDSLTGGNVTVLPVWVLQWPTNHACANCSRYILHVCSGQSFVSCPRILPFTSFAETDLYFPAHWPGYYYRWEGNNIGWTAGSVCNLLHICPFHGGLWARDSVRSLLSPANRLVYPSIHPSIGVFQGISI